VRGFQSATDTSPADPIVAGIRGFAESVVSFVPAGFEAYLRLFHPATRADGSTVRWSEMAAATGTAAHPSMQISEFTGDTSWDLDNQALPGVFDTAPSVGTLPVAPARALAETLARHTTTPDCCWFAVWFGFAATRAEIAAAPSFDLPHRTYHLVTARVADAVVSTNEHRHQSPNIWWPDDGAWCVATEIDFNTTFIACSEACRRDLLSDERLELWPVEPGDRP
jgi:hypothetical protein